MLAVAASVVVAGPPGSLWYVVPLDASCVPQDGLARDVARNPPGAKSTIASPRDRRPCDFMATLEELHEKVIPRAC
jgi:hypothetical protein